MGKPKEVIERIRNELNQQVSPVNGLTLYSAHAAIIAWADSLPDDAHVCAWPKELTRERLNSAADALEVSDWHDLSGAIRALAAIAPVRKKRMVNLWAHGSGAPIVVNDGDSPVGQMWRKVGGPFEIEE